MKNEKFKILIGILIVPVLIAGMISFVQKLAHNQRYGTTNESYTENVMAKSMEEQGYIVYQEVPERIRALVNCEAFDLVQESRDSEEDGEDVQIPDILERMGQEEMIKNVCPLLVSDIASFGTEFVFDAKNCSFTNSELIRQIEACGFPGFSEQLAKIEKIVEKKTKEYGKNYYEFQDELYRFTCQGTTFSLYRMTEDAFNFEVAVNLSTCYVPAKHKELVEKVNAAGGYFLSASQVGGNTEVLTFTKDNAISDQSGESLEGETEVNNKKLILMFRNGSLSDYYVTVAGNETLKLDDKDKEILQICTAGLGKELSDKEYMKSNYGGIYRIFRAK